MKDSLRHSLPVSIVRICVMGGVFLLGCISIVSTQWIGLKIFRKNSPNGKSLIDLTKKQFVALLTFFTSTVAQCKIRITYNESEMPAGTSFKLDGNGGPHFKISSNSVFISNHQIYTDWLYVWFIAYLADMGNYIYIVMKDLSKLPILGYGMQNFNFMFLSRKWDEDKIKLTNQLLSIDADSRGMGPSNGIRQVVTPSESPIKRWPQGRTAECWPYHVIIYPEGTVPSERTKKKSKEYCISRNLPELKHTLVPRVRGLYLTLLNLRKTSEYLYDLTTGYSDLSPDEFGEIRFSLKRLYIFGYSPSVINFYVKVYKMDDIPLGPDVTSIENITEEDLTRFEEWLLKVWYEKDERLANFYKNGNFDCIENKNSSTSIATDFKVKSYFDVVTTFFTIGIIFMVFRWIIKLLFRYLAH